MKNIFIALTSVFLISSITSCSPDTDEAEQQSINAQNQLKTIKIEVIAEVPISQAPSGHTGENYMELQSPGGLSMLNQTVPNQIGENTIIQTFTAAPSSNLNFGVTKPCWSADNTTFEGSVTVVMSL